MTFRKLASAAVVLCAVWGASAMVTAAALGAPDGCPNAEVRSLQSAGYLPDCRAYELVSPGDKEGNSVAVQPTVTQSAVSGEAIKWTSNRAFGDALIEERGAEYVSRRSSEGWSTHGINPAQTGPPTLPPPSMYVYLSDDLTRGVYWAWSPILGGHPNVEGVANLYLRRDVLSGLPGTYELLSDSATALVPRSPYAFDSETEFAAASADGSRILFESRNDLTADSSGTNPQWGKLYEWHEGAVTLVGILPDGSPAEGSIAGSGAANDGKVGTAAGISQGSMSSDGSRIVFTAAPFDSSEVNDQRTCGTLYMRIDDRETIPINASERAEPDPTGTYGACFWTATADDSKLFFTSKQALTQDATSDETNPWTHYYMYDLNAPAGKHLTLLAQSDAPEGPHPGIIGISADASYVYFTSSRISAGDPKVGGIYVWHNGAVRFVAGHTEQFLSNDLGLTGHGRPVSFRVTPDGKTVTFMDQDREDVLKTGYDSKSIPEIMVYNYDTNKLVCASCDPSGAPPRGEAGNNAAIFVEAADTFPLESTTQYENRTLSSDGRYVFFDTPDPLVPEDTNGRRDVYEYDTTLGRAELLSGGTCNCDAAFVDASPDGRNVFIVTHQPLVRADPDTAGDLYDVRTDGGFLTQSLPIPGPCESDDCQGPAKAAPSFSVPVSAAFTGSGNPVIAPEGGSTKRRLTRAQKLARALRACHVKRGKHRAKCEAQARRRYGARSASGKRTSRRAGR